MAKIDFEIKHLPLHPSIAAEIYAVLQPLTGPLQSYRRELAERLLKIQRQWRRRVLQLKVEGWKQLQSVRSVFVYNCPPCACGYTPKTQPCNLRVCPFCHGRRVASVYERIRTLTNFCGQCKVASWRHYFGQYDDADRIYYDADMGLSSFCEEVHPRHRNIRKCFRKERMADAIGGVYWYTTAPYTYQTLAADGSAGRWNALHGCIAVMPATWKSWKDDDLRVISNPDDYQLAWLVGRTFQYRQQWLQSNPKIMTDFLNATHGDVLLSAFGKLAPYAGPSRQ